MGFGQMISISAVSSRMSLNKRFYNANQTKWICSHGRREARGRFLLPEILLAKLRAQYCFAYRYTFYYLNMKVAPLPLRLSSPYSTEPSPRPVSSLLLKPIRGRTPSARRTFLQKTLADDVTETRCRQIAVGSQQESTGSRRVLPRVALTCDPLLI